MPLVNPKPSLTPFLCLLILTVLGLSGCVKSLVPLERTAIFPQEIAPNLVLICIAPPEGITGYWTPSIGDLAGVEDQLEEFLLSEWAKMSHGRTSPPNWKDYYRQVCGIIQHGKKELFISYAENALMNDPQVIADRTMELKRRGQQYDPNWWRKEPISVDDGGSMFFRVIYDPQMKKFTWYDQNFY